MSWISKLLPSIRTQSSKDIPEGVWSKCESCNSILYRAELKRSVFVCPKCGNHMYISARTRLKNFLDLGTTQELATEVGPTDWLKFRDLKKYKDRIATAQKDTKEKDALVVFSGRYQLVYGSDSPCDIETKQLELFVKRISVNDAWPYWKELVQSTSTRMGLVVSPLPCSVNLTDSPEELPAEEHHSQKSIKGETAAKGKQ